MIGNTSNKTATMILRLAICVMALIGIFLLAMGFFATLEGISNYVELHGVNRMNVLPAIMIGALSMAITMGLMMAGWTRIYSNVKQS